MWTQSQFLWIVIAEVAETVGDTDTGDDSKQIDYDNTEIVPLLRKSTIQYKLLFI